MKAFLQGLLIGTLVALPFYLISEQIRYGFVSNHVALWILLVVLCGIGFAVKEGWHLSYVTRIALFALYAVTSVTLVLRVMTTNSVLVAVLLFACVYASYTVFEVAGSK